MPDKKIIINKKTSDKIWNEQHSRVEFILVIKFDG